MAGTVLGGTSGGLAQLLPGGDSNELASYYKNLSAVVGLPHRYRSSADPSGRLFLRHMVADAPLVMIRPGRARFTESTKLQEAFKTILGDEEAKRLGSVDDGGGSSLYKDDGRFGTGTDRRFYDRLREDAKRKRRGTVASAEILGSNLRYFEFEETVNEYLSTVMTLSSRMFTRLAKADAKLPWSPTGDVSLDTMMGGFFTFWAENSTSVSESASSEYGASMVSEIIGKLRNVTNEATFLFGETGGGEALAGATESATSLVGQGGENSAGASMGAAIRGQVPLLPSIWKGSSFQRSYSLSFKFSSPYGHPEAIYRNVLLPFSMILALALPMMRRPSAFSEPFLFQLDCPGHFACDLGMCTSLSFVKGGSEGLWTYDGLPRQIDVTMTVEDLYPTLMASGTVGSLATNIGLMTFLDNMAGINIAASGENTDLITQLRGKMYNLATAPSRGLATAQAKVEDFLNGRITGVFR